MKKQTIRQQFKKLKPQKILSLAVAAAIVGCFVYQPVQAEAKTEYVSEVRMAYGSSAEDAKSKLTAEGFEVYDADVNAGTGEDFVYLGYKKTTDPADAITDIKAVEQDNGYQIYDSATILEGMNGAATTDAVAIMNLVTEFRKSYKNGAKRAQDAYKGLQVYRYANGDEEAGTKPVMLGDFLLNDATEESLTEMVLYADPATFAGMVELLAIGMYNDESNTWLTRAGQKIPTYTTDSVLKANARKLLKSIKSFQDMLLKNTELQKQIDAAATEEEKAKLEEGSASIELGFAMVTLNKYKYKDTTLLKYFFNEDLTAEQLYDIASVMTKADIAVLSQLGLSGLCMVSDNVAETDTSAKDSVSVSDLNTSSEEYDFWSGSAKTDCKVIALTNETIRDITTGNEDEVISGVSNALFSGTVATGGVATIAIGTTAYLWARYVADNNMAKAFTEVGKYLETTPKYLEAGGFVEESVAFNLERLTEDARFIANGHYPLSWHKTISSFSKSTRNLLQNGKLLKSYRATSDFKVAKETAIAKAGGKFDAVCSTVLMVVMVVLVAALITTSIKEYYNPEYTPRPQCMLSLEKMESGEEAYVIYDAVADKADTASVGDTNAYQGLKWLALYTSKDDLKGTPVKANTFSAKTDGTPVCFFGQVKAADLNKNARNHDKTINLYFGKADESTLASVFSNNSLGAVIGVIAAVLVLGGVSMYKKRRVK